MTPNAQYLAFVKTGKIGREHYGKAGHRSRFVGLGDRWRSHYIEGFVTYPGSSRRSFVPVELTAKGVAVLASVDSPLTPGTTI